MDYQTYQVSEIYRAIQGEGWHAGLPCTLVRLQGCNLRCEFCDTPYAQDPEGGMSASLERVVQAVKRQHRKRDIILITGGEPALQNLIPLIDALSNLGPVHIETNGTPGGFEPVGARASWITVSPKSPHSCSHSALLMSDEIKWLVAEQSDVEDLQMFLTQRVLQYGKPKCVSVQPISQDPVATEIAYQACLEYGWRLSLQIHKYLEVK